MFNLIRTGLTNHYSTYFMKKDFSTALTGNGTLIVAAVGRERPEFLQGLTKVILRNGGNILETRA